MTTGDTARRLRLVQLARALARSHHVSATFFDYKITDGHGHVGIDDKSGDQGFTTCPHPDCALVRDSEGAGVEPTEDGAELIRAERQRQQDVEGWTPEHDEKHSDGELVTAAICYAQAGSGFSFGIRELWPWEVSWWKPTYSVRDLVKAGALLAAEIDRQLHESRGQDGDVKETK